MRYRSRSRPDGDNVDPDPMRILMVGSEATPFAKTGGLADVLGALPQALGRLGHDLDVVIPHYRGITGADRIGQVAVPLGDQTIDASIHASTDGRVRTVFVGHPEYFDREALYGKADGDYPDNAARFGLLARAALEWAVSNGATYDVVHAHDWQAGLVPVWLSRFYRLHPSLRRAPAVFTVHNMAYQGIFDANWLQVLGLEMGSDVTDLEYWGKISFLKGGISFSRLITTVSPRYAEEIQTPEYGFGMDGLLRERAADLVGILNGIDYDQWDPMRDPHLPVPFDASRLDGKRAAKKLVLSEYGLPLDEETVDRPLVGMITRLVDQKGLDLVAEIAEQLPRLNASFVLLGTGERRYEALWLGLAASHPTRIGARIGFDEVMAHRIEGGADLFLMPSRFEPCGLNQLFSQRYGTIPVVRATGGLFDTVRNLDPRSGEGTGFTFEEYSPQALLATLRWALDTYGDRKVWRRMQVAGMRQNYSWDASAGRYERLYERVRAMLP
jgi:starch synthase